MEVAECNQDVDYCNCQACCEERLVIINQEGVKYDDGKPPIGLISTRAIIEEAKVMGFGEEKYDRHNWKKGMSWQRLVNALLRHTFAYNSGELLDPETGISHMAHVRCCAGFLLEYEESHPETNDLWKGY